MAAAKPTMRRRKPSSAAMEFVEGKKKGKMEPPKPGTPPRRRSKEAGPAAEGSAEGVRVAKRLYISEDVQRALRLRATCGCRALAL